LNSKLVDVEGNIKQNKITQGYAQISRPRTWLVVKNAILVSLDFSTREMGPRSGT